MSSKHDNIRKAIAAIDAKIAKLEHRRGELEQRLTGVSQTDLGSIPADVGTAVEGSDGLEAPRYRALRNLDEFESGTFMRFLTCLPSPLRKELNSDDLNFLSQEFKKRFPTE